VQLIKLGIAVFDGLVTKLFGRNLSKQTARNRLQMVLVQDRSGLTSQEMDFFRKDILEVLSKYFVLERKGVEIEWQRSDNTTALLINTPVVGRTREASKAAAAN
jgi:cell division topological specificity factor